MTTIAADFRTGVMVSDSRCNSGGTWFPTNKVYRINGELIGISGNCIDEQKWLKWHRGGRKGPRPKMEAFEAVVLRADGVYVYDSSGLEMVIPRGFHAVGSGGSAATAVMIAGHSAKEAVEIACQVDACSGGEICVFDIKDAP
ncbi:MAG: hypothetical protein V4710_20605 [Verrucomicrobiota bacterium]